MTLTGPKPTPTPRLGGTADSVVSVIKSKVLQEFIPQVPDIVTFIEKQYGFDTATARNYLQTRVGNVLAALSTPLLDEQRKRQRKVDTQDAELEFAKDVYTRGTVALKAVRNDLHEYEQKAVAAAKETASLKAQNSKHSENLMALMRAFGLPTKGGKLSTSWTKLNKSVDALLRQRQEYETMKQQLELLQEKLKEKSDQLIATVEGEQKQSGERIARLSDELVAKRKELETYKMKAEYEIDTLKQSVDQKNEQIEAFKTNEATVQARIEQLTANDVSKQSLINQLTDNIVKHQSDISELTAARDGSLSMLATAKNECSITVSYYTTQIDDLNKEINALRTKMLESTQCNDQTQTCLAEFNMIKSLYDRVSESLRTAQAHYKETVNYNEPVTNIILDVLAKVQANATDFSDVKIPKPTPISAPDDDDTEAVTAPTQRRSKRLRLKALKGVSEPTKRHGNGVKRRRRLKRTPYNEFGDMKSSKRDELSKQTPYEFGDIQPFSKNVFDEMLKIPANDYLGQTTLNSDGNNVDAPSQIPNIEIQDLLSVLDYDIPENSQIGSDQESVCHFELLGSVPSVSEFNELIES